MNKQLISRAEEISFSMWSKLAASMIGLDEDARAAHLERANVDFDAWDEAQQTHLRALAKATSAGDDSLVDEHSRNIQEQLKAPIAGAANVDETILPAVNRAKALPFAPAVGTAPQLAAPSAVHPPPPEDVDPSGETLPFAGGPAATLPFGSGGVGAGGELRFMRMEDFARLSAELRRRPADRLAVLASNGFPDDAAFQKLAQLWAIRFQQSPELRVRFEQLVAQRGGAQ